MITLNKRILRSEKLKFVFRVDASKNIGMGHIMRCIALSEELIKRGHICYFLSKIRDDFLINKIKKMKIEFFYLDNNLTLLDDLKKLINLSKKYYIDWIITDNYWVTSDYLKVIKEKGFNVITIDDLAYTYYYSDLVVNQNINADKFIYKAESYTKFLLGTKFVILRNELLKKEKKTFKNNVNKIMVTFGGTDNNNLTLKVLKILSKIKKDVEFSIICGPFNPYYKKIESYFKKSNQYFRVISQPKEMANLYLETDIAISAGGTTSYELAYFGIPNIIITIAENQNEIAKELDKQNISFFIGDKNNFKENELLNKVKKLTDNKNIRETMSKNGQRNVDGKGKIRIIDFLESL